MPILLLNLVFIFLLAVGIFVLYFQARVYKDLKQLINEESKALKVLRHKNLEALRSRFSLRRVKL